MTCTLPYVQQNSTLVHPYITIFTMYDVHNTKFYIGKRNFTSSKKTFFFKNVRLSTRKLFTVHCTLYSVQCTVYSVHFVHCTLYSVQCTVYGIQCTVYTIHSILNRTSKSISTNTKSIFSHNRWI